MTFDTPKIPELIVLKAEILLGIPEKRLYVPPLGICLEYPGSLPADLIGSEVGRRTSEFFIVIADQDSSLTDPFEIYRLGKDLIDPIADLHPPKRFPGQGADELADCHVSSLDFDVPVGLESGHPMQALALEEFDEVLRSEPVVKECALNVQAKLQGMFHQFLGQFDLGLEGNPFLLTLPFLQIQTEVQGMTVSLRVNNVWGDNVMSQDVSVLAVIPENTDTFYLLAGLMSESVVNAQPSLPSERPLGFEDVDSGIVDVLLLPDPGGKKSIERAGVLGLNENPVDAFHRQVSETMSPRT